MIGFAAVVHREETILHRVKQGEAEVIVRAYLRIC